MSRTDARGEDSGPRTEAALQGSDPSVSDADAPLSDADAPDAKWMLRDDEFLLESDREYVLRDDGRSWRSWVWPVAFGVLVAVMVADAALVGAATAAGLDPLTFLAPVVAEVGLRGLAVAKATVAVLLVLLPGVTGSSRSIRRAGVVAYALVALSVLFSIAVAGVAVS